MTADDIIESYVLDVSRRLPRRQRADVATELRLLLREELEARAADTGRHADEAMALELVRGFGRPADVATRYRPPVTVIDPVDGRRFLGASAAGIAVIWVVGLLAAVQPPLRSATDVSNALGAWWTGPGLGALWWPGLMVVCFAAAARARRRRHRHGTADWKPPAADRDDVNRAGAIAATVFFVCGTAILVNPGYLLGSVLDRAFDGRAAPQAYAALDYDEEFLRLRGPALLVLMVANVLVYATVAARGRWTTTTRRLGMVLSLVICAVLTWALAAGDVFQAAPTDETFRGVVALIVLLTLVDLGQRLRRQRRRVALTPST